MTPQARPRGGNAGYFLFIDNLTAQYPACFARRREPCHRLSGLPAKALESISRNHEKHGMVLAILETIDRPTTRGKRPDLRLGGVRDTRHVLNRSTLLKCYNVSL